MLVPAAHKHIKLAIDSLMDTTEVKNCIASEHTLKTPVRFADALFELIEGVYQDPRECLRTIFKNDGYDEIVYVNSISFVSVCAHHLLPFFGKAHFGYLPDQSIVGLSKIPRLIKTYAKRPQLQEKLTVEIVDTFNEVVSPKGCGLVMEGYHLCMSLRGVQDEQAYTKTTALRGCFKESDTTKAEFLSGIKQVTSQIWP